MSRKPGQVQNAAGSRLEQPRSRGGRFPLRGGNGPVGPRGRWVRSRASAGSRGRATCAAIGASTAGLSPHRIRVGDLLRVALRRAADCSWSGLPARRARDRPTRSSSGLQGVSCPSANACVAVGGDSGAAVAERWNGRTWSIQPTPSARNEYVQLQAAACTSPAGCTAVGHLSTNRTLAERWDGRKWSIQRTSQPHGAIKASLAGISCGAPRACTAVGSYTTALGRERPLAERWNGRKWSIQPTPIPAGATSSKLTSVSCASPTACTAVGWYDAPSGDELTLVERWTSRRCFRARRTRRGRGVAARRGA